MHFFIHSTDIISAYHMPSPGAGVKIIVFLCGGAGREGNNKQNKTKITQKIIIIREDPVPVKVTFYLVLISQ